MAHLQPLARSLQEQLIGARKERELAEAVNARGTLIQTPKTGRKLASAYEHFRNVAEYTEEHLLLQHAIRRFYTRDIFLTGRELETIGQELIVELTLAGYLKNNSVSTEAAAAIQRLVQDAMQTYGELRQAHIPRDQASRWILDILSVQTEELLNPHGHLRAIIYVAYQHYLRLFPRQKLVQTAKEDAHYELSLYIAIHQALLKSDEALVRHDLLQLHAQDAHQTKAFVAFNQNIDHLYAAPFTLRLRRAVSRYGAPFRVLKELADNRTDLAEILDDREEFLRAYRRQVEHEYKRVKQRLNQGIIRSLLFLLITKVFIGVAVEIPYDLLLVGHVALLPLTLNLLFPPCYIASLRFMLRLPTQANAAALSETIDEILFASQAPTNTDALRLGLRKLSLGAQLVYSVLFLIPLISIMALLRLLDFSFLQGVIFFIFLSTASFLGLRLSRIIRELEIVDKSSGFLTSAADFFYLPFMLMGQWLSGKYARLNAVAFFMDLAIELPLKTGLRLVRQWTSFLREKRDEIM